MLAGFDSIVDAGFASGFAPNPLLILFIASAGTDVQKRILADADSRYPVGSPAREALKKQHYLELMQHQMQQVKS